MISEKELISKLQELRQVKPNQNWVVFTKRQILGIEAPVKAPDEAIKPSYADIISSVFSLVFQRKLAYALAVLLFVFAGTLGFLKLMPQNNVDVAEKSPAALVAIKSDVEQFKIKSKNLAEATKYNPESVPLAIEEVKEITVELIVAIKKDPQLAKEIALEVNNNKTYLDIEGGSDLKEASDVLYKIIDEQMIKDLENTTLTESQQEALKIAKDLYDKGEYTSALENILLLNAAIGSVISE